MCGRSTVACGPSGTSDLRHGWLHDPDGSAANAGDGVIDVCELTHNPIIRNVFAPDVGLFDTAGQYAPGAATPKSLMSIGMGFTAHPATF
jgi:hypothetical protein